MKNNIIEKQLSTNIIKEMFFALLPAQILSVATSKLASIVNGFVIGNYLSQASLVALGFVTPLTSIIGSVSFIISGGSEIIAGRYMGRGEYKRLDDAFTNAITASLVSGFILSISCYFFASPIALLLGANSGAKEATALYVKGLSFGIIPMILTPTVMVFLQMANRSNYSLAGTVVLAAASLCFSMLNVQVIKGDVYGMGIASSLSQYAALGFVIIPFIKDKSLMKIKWHTVKGNLIAELLKFGSPTALASALYAFRNVLINAIALDIEGESAVSALAIMNSSCGIFDAVNIGTGAVIMILSSIFVGERDEKRLKELVSFGAKLGAVLGFAKLIIIVLLGKPLVCFLGAKDALIEESYTLYVLYATAMPFNMLLLAIVNPLQSLGKIKLVNILYALSALVFPIGWCLIAKRMIGIYAVWSCYLMAEIFSFIILIILAIKEQNIFPKYFTDLLLIEKELDCSNKLSISLNTMEQVISVSERVCAFCKENGIDDKRSNFSGLCLEEMAGNVIEHGFPKGKKKNYSVDIFVCCDNGKVSMRIRNNTPYFDPRSKLSVSDSDDICKNIGIRMVSRIAKSMDYQSSFGMNVLSIEI